VAGALVLGYVLFHLTNHLLGLMGPDVHAAVMKMGRLVYRSTVIEPVLVTLLLFQVIVGVRLAWRWSSLPADAFRVFQIGSGTYLAAFILTHLNSAFVSARAVHHLETDWAWASGAPTGLIHDAWSIRLVPRLLCTSAPLFGPSRSPHRARRADEDRQSDVGGWAPVERAGFGCHHQRSLRRAHIDTDPLAIVTTGKGLSRLIHPLLCHESS